MKLYLIIVVFPCVLVFKNKSKKIYIVQLEVTIMDDTIRLLIQSSYSVLPFFH
jgi:hypothetical protein